MVQAFCVLTTISNSLVQQRKDIVDDTVDVESITNEDIAINMVEQEETVCAFGYFDGKCTKQGQEFIPKITSRSIIKIF